MALYIDPPRWPAHGTHFSHVVSDRSVAELHAFAQAIGLSGRAFDEDHYDVPADLYDAALEQGALPVSANELIRVLRRSGLRVPAVERSSRVVPLLRRQWQSLRPQDPGLGELLLTRWGREHRAYHTPVHLHECLTRIDILDRTASEEVLLAAWFHDAVYDGRPGEDEAASAELARQEIGGGLGEEVARLVLLTRDHRVASDDREGAVLVDADLGILAAPEPRYRRYAASTRQEYGHYPEPQWRRGRAAFLSRILDQEHIFTTPYGRTEWEGPARANLQWELSSTQPVDPVT